MIAIACALLSAAGFYFSTGLGEQWWLAWIAPVPVLWFAFGPSRYWQSFAAAWLAFAFSTALRAYIVALPVPVLIQALVGPALGFAVVVIGAKLVRQRLGALAAMLAFAALWAAVDFLTAFNQAGGAVATPAASQVGAPALIQVISLTGFAGVTFLLGLVSGGIALSLRARARLPAAIAVAAFAANAAFGYARMSTPPASAMRVALIESDDTIGKIRDDARAITLAAVDAYLAQIEKLRGAGVALVVLPENIAQLAAGWRGEAEAKLAAVASDLQATVVAGFNTDIDGAQRNVSLGFVPGAPQVTYQKRRLVPGLETSRYTPGPGPQVLSNGIGLEICKDMDFHATLRNDAVATKPLLLAVPAWDFDKDDWSHARVAVMRSVENGVPMARTARDGLLTLNDRYGRIVARARSVGGFTTLIGELPLDGRGGDTIYDRIGDGFGWLCVALSIALVGVSFARRDKIGASRLVVPGDDPRAAANAIRG
jgi:apolipoprotein N-acyltransferase